MKPAIIALIALGLLFVALSGFMPPNVATRGDHEVTWYQDGEYAANGERFNPNGYTCAVLDKAELNHWFRFEYQGLVVYCYANDRMPEGSKAQYDLTPEAFKRLAPLYQGRLKGVKARVVE